MNPYEILGIKPTATDDEIKAAYRELVKKYHPDKYQNNPLADLAEEKLREVNEAYDMIMKSKGPTGSAYTGKGAGRGSSNDQYQTIRREIDRNNLGAAEALLNRIQVKDAEWMFLSGMISYKKGWYDDAVSKIQQASNMNPSNQEYASALNSIMNMGGSYRNAAMGRGYGNVNDAFCQALQCYCCFDFCCDCI